MPELGDDKQLSSTYPPESLYESWSEHADDLDMSISQYIIRMVEAGRNQINLEETTSESIIELRQRNADLRGELERQRTRNEELERQLHHTAQAEIIEYVEDNTGVTTPQIIQRVADTVPGRVAGHLDILEGEVLEDRDGSFYPRDSDEAPATASASNN